MPCVRCPCAQLVDAFDIADGATGAAAEDEMIRRLLQRLEVWLARDKRILEASSARPLTRAFLVSIDVKTNLVASVLLSAASDQPKRMTPSRRARSPYAARA